MRRLTLYYFLFTFLTACSTTPSAPLLFTPTPNSLPTAAILESTLPATETPVPATLTPIPTLTPTTRPTDPPTTRPTDYPTAQPPGQLGPANFPPDVNPLTGETVADPNVLNRRPLAIKISNFPSCVRPQSGLSLADLVFEHYAEGGTTRFTAIFYSHDAPKVGSIRSARLIDLELPAMYSSLFAFSGASDGVLKRLKEVDFKDWIISPEFERGHKAFYRVAKDTLPADCQLQEHTLFTGTDRLWADADKKGINTRPTLDGMVFNGTPPPDGQTATTVILPYTAAYVQWNYNAELGRYYRYVGGGLHSDASTHAPITAANVVVVFAHHQTTDILEDKVGYNPRTGKGGNYSLEIQLWGVGPALVYRDGLAYSVTWLRQDRFGVLGLVDAAGQLFPLKPGPTWFQLVNLDSPITQPDPDSWRIAPTRPTPVP